ncbi:MAG: hypothetical protein AWM53_01513 [Candidatus Dichloromethanomonas elyunquensis]|nr:MAG: hypothetical protein AWM53_01513 [Candidatus Dichloromethanomonas elyunquensis]
MNNKFRISWSTILISVGSLLFMVIVLGPLIGLVLKWVQAQKIPSDFWQLIIPSGRRLLLLSKTVSYSLGVSVITLLIGFTGAFALLRRPGRLSRTILWWSVATVAVPPYIHALSWSSALYYFNQSMEFFTGWRLPVEGWRVSLWVQSMALLPFALGLSLMALACVEQNLVKAGYMLQSDRQVMKQVILPLAAPVLAGAGLLIFLLTLMDYSVPSLFQVNIYPLEIFAEFSATNDPLRALLLALPLVILAVIIAGAAGLTWKKASVQPGFGFLEWLPTFRGWPGWRLFERISVTLMVLQIIVPILMLLKLVGSWQSFVVSLASSKIEIAYTFGIMFITAAAALPLAYAVAIWLNQRSRFFLGGLPALFPLVMPAPLIGIGLINLWNRPETSAVYGTFLMTVMAALSRFSPWAVMILQAQLSRQNKVYLEAARILQKNGHQTFFKITLPMMSPGFIAAASLVFILTGGELGATLLVVPPGQGTLTLKIYNYLHYGSSDQVAGLCLLIALISAVVGFVLIKSVLRMWGGEDD